MEDNLTLNKFGNPVTVNKKHVKFQQKSKIKEIETSSIVGFGRNDSPA